MAVKNPFEKLKGQFIKVGWKDIVTWHGWTDDGAFKTKGHGPAECISYGFLTNNEEEFITLSATRSDGMDEFNQHISIPKGCVTKYKQLAD